MIELREVHKTYRRRGGEVRAVAGVSLTVAPGEFVAVTGPSGSGKSTLLHLMGGLDVPTAGTVLVDGTALAALSDDALTVFRRRKVGFVFQAFNLLPTHSVEENVALPLELDGRPAREVRERVGRALERVGLLERRTHRPDELSGGEMQRTAIARALAIDPVVLLADEPTGNLDSVTGGQVLDALGEANARGCTVVLVTHEAAAAARAHRTVRLTDGRLVA
ncbi:MAG TPA: ABC transporter ATP-binding protein [Candidatus Limnocylindria bacterium]|nr:ABC transporter ATP-binding protein [Candidatus Limnocylindria bacterium]